MLALVQLILRYVSPGDQGFFWRKFHSPFYVLKQSVEACGSKRWLVRKGS